MLLGSIDENNKNIGKEVTVNWRVLEINNEGEFFTDTNGMEMQKRVLNKRPTYDFKQTDFVAGNYYPVNSAIVVQDEKSGL